MDEVFLGVGGAMIRVVARLFLDSSISVVDLPRLSDSVVDMELVFFTLRGSKRYGKGYVNHSICHCSDVFCWKILGAI